ELSQFERPDGPPLFDAIDLVHPASEHPDETSHRPDRQQHTEDEQKPGHPQVGEFLEEVTDPARRFLRRDGTYDVEKDLRRLIVTPENAEDREPDHRRRQQSEERVEGEARGGISATVRRERPDDPPDRE